MSNKVLRDDDGVYCLEILDKPPIFLEILYTLIPIFSAAKQG